MNKKLISSWSALAFYEKWVYEWLYHWQTERKKFVHNFLSNHFLTGTVKQKHSGLFKKIVLLPTIRRCSLFKVRHVNRCTNLNTQQASTPSYLLGLPTPVVPCRADVRCTIWSISGRVLMYRLPDKLISRLIGIV